MRRRLGAVSVVGVALAGGLITPAQAYPSIAMSGRVLSAAGTPVAGAVVTFDGPNRSSARTSTDGRYTVRDLMPGQYDVLVDPSAGLASAWFPAAATADRGEPVVVTDAPQQQAPDIEVLDEGTISGRVITVGGQPVVNTLVKGRLIDRLRADDVMARTDSQGRFQLTGAETGHYELVLYPNGAGVTSYRAVDAVGGRDIDLGDVLVAPGTTVSGRVTEDGAPVQGALVEASATKAATLTNPTSYFSATTDADGYYTLTGVPEGEWFLRAWAQDMPGYSGGTDRQTWSPVVVRSGEATTADIALAGHGTITGTVTLHGEPVAKVRVGVEGTSVQAYTDASGSFTLTRVPQGSHLLSMATSGYPELAPQQYYGPATYPGGARRVVVEPGSSQDLAVDLMPMPRLVIDPLPGTVHRGQPLRIAGHLVDEPPFPTRIVVQVVNYGQEGQGQEQRLDATLTGDRWEATIPVLDGYLNSEVRAWVQPTNSLATWAPTPVVTLAHAWPTAGSSITLNGPTTSTPGQSLHWSGQVLADLPSDAALTLRHRTPAGWATTPVTRDGATWHADTAAPTAPGIYPVYAQWTSASTAQYGTSTQLNLAVTDPVPSEPAPPVAPAPEPGTATPVPPAPAPTTPQQPPVTAPTRPTSTPTGLTRVRVDSSGKSIRVRLTRDPKVKARSYKVTIHRANSKAGTYKPYRTRTIAKATSSTRYPLPKGWYRMTVADSAGTRTPLSTPVRVR